MYTDNENQFWRMNKSADGERKKKQTAKKYVHSSKENHIEDTGTMQACVVKKQTLQLYSSIGRIWDLNENNEIGWYSDERQIANNILFQASLLYQCLWWKFIRMNYHSISIKTKRHT